MELDSVMRAKIVTWLEPKLQPCAGCGGERWVPATTLTVIGDSATANVRQVFALGCAGCGLLRLYETRLLLEAMGLKTP